MLKGALNYRISKCFEVTYLCLDQTNSGYLYSLYNGHNEHPNPSLRYTDLPTMWLYMNFGMMVMVTVRGLSAKMDAISLVFSPITF